jgi:hypothetical protein
MKSAFFRGVDRLANNLLARPTVILAVCGLVAASLFVPRIALRSENGFRQIISFLVLLLLILTTTPLGLFYGFVFLSWLPVRISFATIPMLGRLLTDATAIEVTVLVLGPLWLARSFLRPGPSLLRERRLYLPLLLMLLGGIIALPSSLAFSDSLLRFRNVVLYFIIVFLLTVQILETPRQVSRVLKILLVSWCLLGLYALWAQRSGMAGTELNTMGGLRLGGTLSFGFFGYLGLHPNTMSVCLAVMMPLALVYGLYGPTGRDRRFGFVTAALLGATLILTFGRGAYFGAAAGLLVVFLIGWRRGAVRLTRMFVLAIIVVTLIALLFGRSSSSDLITTRLAELANPLQAGTFVSRVDTWQLALQTQPLHLLRGWGFAGSPVMPGWIWEHNTLLYLLDGMGVLGTLGFLWMLVNGVRWSGQAINTNDPIAFMVGTGVIGSITTIAVCGVTYGWPYSAMEAAMTAILLGTAAVLALRSQGSTAR